METIDMTLEMELLEARFSALMDHWRMNPSEENWAKVLLCGWELRELAESRPVIVCTDRE